MYIKSDKCTYSVTHSKEQDGCHINTDCHLTNKNKCTFSQVSTLCDVFFVYRQWCHRSDHKNIHSQVRTVLQHWKVLTLRGKIYGYKECHHSCYIFRMKLPHNSLCMYVRSGTSNYARCV